MKFSELDLHPSIQKGVQANNFEECTDIQEAAIEPILNGRDVAGLAQTGTGKTAAFVLPLLDRVLRAKDFQSKLSDTENMEESFQEAETSRFFSKWRENSFILILVPTRELAEQVHENIKKLGQFTDMKTAVIYGGTGYEAQTKAFRDGVDFVVATPGRLIDLYKDHVVDLNQVCAVVFDEADRMFDMGFKDDMRYILRRVPRERQFLVFSATLNFDVLNVAYEFGSDPLEVNVSKDQTKADNVDDEIFHVGHFEKPKYILSILKKHKPKQAIIFSNFKHNVDRIAKFLSDNGMPAMGISSLLSQSQRNRVMELFRAENDSNILVATDVAARGLDVKGVDMVLNFELPDDAENYVHRIGRTGRAGAKGLAYAVVSDKDVEALARIESYLGHKLTIGWIDDADIIEDFKEFPQEKRRDRGPRSQSKGGRDQRRSKGGGDYKGGRGNRNDKRGDRKGGPRGEERGDQKSEHKQKHKPKGPHKSKSKYSEGANKKSDSKRSGPAKKRKSNNQGYRKKQNRSYKHKPSQPQVSPSQKSVASKVTGFLKKLFS